MDEVGLVSAFIAARVGELQLAAAAKLLRMNAAQSADKIIGAAQQNLDRLANVAAGIGTNVDISV